MNKTRTGSFESDYRFTGKELDDESDFHYFGARYYDSMVGRFVSVDPLYAESGEKPSGNIAALNLYGYSPNPLRFIDGEGLSFMDSISKAVSWADNKIDQGIQALSNTGAGKWLGEKTFDLLVDDNIKNADPQTQAAYYSGLADGLGEAYDTTKKAFISAELTVASMGAGGLVSGTIGLSGFTSAAWVEAGTALTGMSGIFELSAMLSEKAGGPTWLGNALNVASDLSAVGSALVDMRNAYKLQKMLHVPKNSLKLFKNPKHVWNLYKWGKGAADATKSAIKLGKHANHKKTKHRQ
jgi:RHS repeat-associated protein